MLAGGACTPAFQVSLITASHEGFTMPFSSSQPHVTAVLDDERDAVEFATCPMCHTPGTLTRSALERGSDWRCGRCGQQWDAARLATVAAYAAWVVERELSNNLPSQQLGGNT